MTKAKNRLVLLAIAECGGLQSDLAERLGCAQQTVSRLLTGEIKIDANWAVRISRATSGAVKVTELYPELAELVEQQASA